jgi:hypothetical protein
MSHVRQQIRDAAIADLTGLTTTGVQVFSARIAPLTAGELPGLNVLVRDESADWDAMGKIARTGRLIVEGWAQGGDGLLDKLDTIAAEVETAIYDETKSMNLLLQNIGPPTTQIELPEPEEGAARRTGVVRIMFPLTYRTDLGAPETLS